MAITYNMEVTMSKRINFVLTSECEALLNECNARAPKGFVLNMSRLLNTILEAELRLMLNAADPDMYKHPNEI